MQKFLADYATAAHLALMAVAPLVLYPFCSPDTVASVLLWLSLISAAWVVMAPACRPGEMPHKARARISSEMLRDPLMWFLLVAVAFAGLRALNGGIALVYDAESMTWSINPPDVEILPGSVSGAGFLPFAACVSLFVILQGARHSLNAEGAIAFFTASSAIAGISAILAAMALSYGNASVEEMVSCSYVSPSFAGTAYGIYALMGLVALFGCIGEGWRRAEPFAVLGLVCSSVGLALFSPPATFTVFVSAFAVITLISFPLMKGRFAGSASLRCILAIIMAVGAVVLLSMFDGNFSAFGEKRDALLDLRFFPEGFGSARDALSSIALKSWKENPWLGSGLGSFPIDIRFIASQSDWTVISPGQTASVNGWWQILAERGVVGALVLIVAAGFLAWTYFNRLVKSFGRGIWHPACVLGPFVAVALIALAFVDSSLLRSDVLLPTAAVLALSAVSFRGSGSKSDI